MCVCVYMFVCVFVFVCVRVCVCIYYLCVFIDDFFYNYMYIMRERSFATATLIHCIYKSFCILFYEAFSPII